MKCLVLTPHRYGIREVAERVGAEWEMMGHTVDYELARGEAARIGPITIGTPGIALWWYRKLKEVAANGDEYDLVWTHQPLAPILPSRDPSFWDRVIVTFHTTARAEYELARDGVYPSRRVPYHWVTKRLEARFYQQLQDVDGQGPHYTVVSPHLRDEIELFGIENAEYVPNGIVTPDEVPTESIREAYGIPSGATLVFNLGSLTPQKRADDFARVMREVTDSASDVYCVMAGKGPLADTVRKHTSERLHWIGYISEHEKWRGLADADVFVSLSAYEGMPVASLEALSSGTPVILSNIPSHRNVIENYGASGELVSLDPDEIEQSIERLSGSRAEVSLPDWSEVAAAYLEILDLADDSSLQNHLR